MEKLSVNNFLTIVITTDGRLYKVNKSDVNQHRNALEETYNHFKECGLYIMPYPFFRGNNITCQMIAAEGNIAFMNISTNNPEGMLYIPFEINDIQKYILSKFNFEEFEMHVYTPDLIKLEGRENYYGKSL